MPELFQRTFRIESTRCPGWDYASPGNYFVTICTQHHQSYFGEIVKEVMFLNQAGAIVHEEILRTSVIRPNIWVDSWVIMPDHVHLIIRIEHQNGVETPRRGVSTESPNHWKPGSLGVIVNQFKGACTRRIRSEVDIAFAWQPRFYDHIIRTDEDLANLREYISLNPKNGLEEARETHKPLAHA